LRWLAVNTAIENWDAYGRMAHNYYLYGDPSDGGRLKWIPWDHNMSFSTGAGFGGGGRIPIGAAQFGGAGPGGGAGAGGDAPFTLPPGIENIVRDGAVAIFGMNGNDDVLHSQAGMAWPLISQILSDEVYAAKYRGELERALGGLFETEAFTRRARELQAMITPYAIGQQGEQRTHTTLTSPGAFMQALDGPSGLLARVNARRERIRAVLDADASANSASEDLVSEP
jgi:spore coat protein H